MNQRYVFIDESGDLGKKKGWRLTLTRSVFNRSKIVVVLVSGKRKAATLKEVMEGCCFRI